MSLQSANEFVVAVANSPTLTEETKLATENKSPEDAVLAISELGKREGYDFTPAEALEVRKNYVRPLSESELDAVAGGGGGFDPLTFQLTFAGSQLGSRIVPGGGIIGGGVGAGIGTAIGGGSASESIAAGATAANQGLNDTKSVVQQIFSGW